ncbi:hypothetical protein OM945_06710 [Levilactobacillus namurensis]|nr:hypothetical protein [Levilactobacillus namurensis]MCW3778554.1 hypothetical protein [Levilactobacillus namurensis]
MNASFRDLYHRPDCIDC